MPARKRIHYLLSVASISLVLIMLSLFGLMLYMGNHLSGYLKENILMSAYLHDSISPAEQNELKANVLEAPFVKSYLYIDKEQAAASETKELGQDFVEQLGFNPLPASYNIFIKKEYATPEKIEDIKKRIKSCTAIDDLRYEDSDLEKLESNFRTIVPILLVLSLILSLIAVVLINNTVRLNIFSQRFLIKSMHYVGATQNFIMRPFIKRAILNGLYAGLIAAFFTFNIGYLLLYFMPELDIVLPDFNRSINLILLLMLAIALSLTGILITTLSTWVSTRKYLRMKIDELY